MSTRTSRSLRVAALSSAGALVALMASPSLATAAAADGNVEVVNTETVQVYLTPDGKVKSRRVYEQLVMTGKGEVDLANPISTHSLRNLDGFDGFAVKDGSQQVKADVDGVVRRRTVSDFRGDLPLELHAKYRLDGKDVKPGDVVGESGRLEVMFTVRNVTARPRPVSFSDGKGGTINKDVDVPLPLVGSLTTVAPASFTNVTSGQANMAGDGKGGTQLSFTMTLFPPIGSDTATFGYSADIEDGVVPRVNVTALPINPLESPTFQTAATSYQGGASTGAELAAGATEIDTNLLKLRDGAGELLAGLLKLHAGSQELQAGLSGDAAPGAQKLADGAGRLSDGTGEARTGSKKLTAGLGQLSDGLAQLSTAEGLPKASGAVDLLKAGVDQILAGFGAAGQTDTLLDGLARLEAGAAQIKGGLQQLRGDGSPATPGLVGAKGGVDQVKAGLDAATASDGSIQALLVGLNALKTLDCGPTCQSVIDTQIIPGVQGSKANLEAASVGLGQVSGGLATAIGALNTQLIPGTDQLLVGAGKAKAGAGQLKAGVGTVRGGLEQLDEGLTKAVTGVLRLNTGARDAYSGSGDLADGLGQLDDGAGQIADGAGELATGLGDAADGSKLLADGLGEAAGGAPQIVDGAGRLSAEGTQVIAGKGTETAQNYGQLYAVMEAGSRRAQTEDMAFGAPAGAEGLTAYSFIMEGEDGEDSRNLVRGLAGVGLLAAGGAVLAFRRRLV